MLNKLVVVGVNHDSASVELRERIAFAPEKVHQSLSALIRDTAVTETVILSTCNRTELYGVLPEAADALAVSDQLSQWLASHHQLDLNQILPSIYRNHSVAAASHLVRVAAGLNSMVLGEPQIFGQMKSAFAVAQEAGAVGFHLNLIFPEAFRIAKKVRTDTAIGENPVSVAYAAVDLARQIFRDMDRSTALLLGAGETIELVAKHLRDAGLGKLVIANRTLERAQQLASQFDAEAILLADVTERLPEADIVISSTGSQLPILGKGAVEEAIKTRRWRPVLMIDLAVPRDIEPQVADISDIYLYTVDDMREVIEENLRLRASEASKADEIVSGGIQALREGLLERQSADVVKTYRDSALALQQAELEKALKMLEKGGDPGEVMSRLARDLTNKLIHAPTAGLRQLAKEGGKSDVSKMAAVLGLTDFDEERDEGTTLQ
ncbi:MAG: glutamyl-tRNA reductase [Luminiphilus sp.]|nr:glutamyl-tRNA reductase [Luminiphilus sp.]